MLAVGDKVEKVESFNIARLLWCCDDLGVEIKALPTELKISQKTFEKLLKGENVLTFGQLQRIADFFGRSALFFLESGQISNKQASGTQYRTLQNQKPAITPKLRKLIRAVEKQRKVLIELTDEDESIEPVAFPELHQLQTLREKAEVVRSWLGLEESSHYTFDDYRQAIEFRGVFVFVSNAYSGRWQIDKDSPVRGFSLYYEHYPVISVKKAESKSAQTFTLLHELAHLLLHKDSFIDDEDDLFWSKGKEQEANELASKVLMPYGCFEQLDFERFPEDQPSEFHVFFEPVAKQLGISTEVLLVQAVKDKKLDFEQYRLYKSMMSRPRRKPESPIPRNYRHREPINMFGVPYVSAVLNALNEKEISLSRASKYLDGIQVNDIKKLESHLLISANLMQ
ncbi:MAG: peptidase [Proteobacteria bacterium]|nr:MAG: peptidase [Pseudomonadota bacterium]